MSLLLRKAQKNTAAGDKASSSIHAVYFSALRFTAPNVMSDGGNEKRKRSKKCKCNEPDAVVVVVVLFYATLALLISPSAKHQTDSAHITASFYTMMRRSISIF